MSIQNVSNPNFVSTQNRALPCEGAIAVPITLDFSGSVTQYDLNLLQQFQATKITLVQTAWVDMADATHDDLTIFIPTVNQRIKAKKGTQGYYPLLCPNPPNMQFSVGILGDIVQVTLLNVSIAGVVWSV